MKTDARVRYTKLRIREAFFCCLDQKSVSKITVKEICDHCLPRRMETQMCDTFVKAYGKR